MPFPIHPHMLRHACGYARKWRLTDSRTFGGDIVRSARNAIAVGAEPSVVSRKPLVRR
jgi:hypothetical protein